jgi:hypothetical protein
MAAVAAAAAAFLTNTEGDAVPQVAPAAANGAQADAEPPRGGIDRPSDVSDSVVVPPIKRVRPVTPPSQADETAGKDNAAVDSKPGSVSKKSDQANKPDGADAKRRTDQN